MQLQMHTHWWERRSPDWNGAVVSGFAAGAMLMLVELLWSSIIMGANPWEPSQKVAAIVVGQDVLNSGEFNLVIVVVALIT